MLIITPATTSASTEAIRAWDWVRSADGRTVADHGTSAASQLPKGGECVLVLPPSDVRWHHIQLPPHPSTKRIAVLASVLDELVLGEPEQLHAALPESANVALPLWCAVVHKPWLSALLKELRDVGITPHRIAPMLSPQANAQALVWPWQDSWRLSIGTPLGVLHTCAEQDLAALAPDDEALNAALHNVRCPSALAGSVEQAWPTLKLQVRSAQALLMEAAQSAWNLAQFDLKVSATQRRGQALWRAWTQFWYAPAWRMTRLGVITALAAALVTPPTLAWRARQSQTDMAQAARQLVQADFPDIRLVIDPVAQMQRAVTTLARTKGQTAGPDITTALSQLAALNHVVVTQLRWQNGNWTIRTEGSAPDASLIRAFSNAGWHAQKSADQTWTLRAAL